MRTNTKCASCFVSLTCFFFIFFFFFFFTVQFSMHAKVNMLEKIPNARGLYNSIAVTIRVSNKRKQESISIFVFYLKERNTDQRLLRTVHLSLLDRRMFILFNLTSTLIIQAYSFLSTNKIKLFQNFALINHNYVFRQSSEALVYGGLVGHKTVTSTNNFQTRSAFIYLDIKCCL